MLCTKSKKVDIFGDNSEDTFKKQDTKEFEYNSSTLNQQTMYRLYIPKKHGM